MDQFIDDAFSIDAIPPSVMGFLHIRNSARREGRTCQLGDSEFAKHYGVSNSVWSGSALTVVDGGDSSGTAMGRESDTRGLDSCAHHNPL